MEIYIKPEITVYRIDSEALLAAESSGQIIEGYAKNHDAFLYNDRAEENNTFGGSLWDDEDNAE